MAAISLRNNVGFASALNLIKNDSLEETVQFLWNTIVVEWFPSSQGFRLGFKTPSLANNNMPEVVVMEIRAVAHDYEIAGNYPESQILMIECKRPSADTPSQWNTALTGQFRDDLSQTLNRSERLFGALAIGKKVKFFSI